ncbi:MAG: peptide chain release factor N(5)-glutamine methyltransferase [Actinobacteria bacterium]|nr:peptide chain release factor N(5)-glutamine methyltransferase [Actinomycetota bacterium]
MQSAEATIRSILPRASEYLASKGVDTPRFDAELLLAHVLHCSRLDLYLEHDRTLAEVELERFRKLVSRRGLREPAAYILGEWGFRRLTLRVDDRALVPRPETEAVVERCLARLEGVAAPLVLDVGTGSGAIALSIADEHPGAVVTAIDNSATALELANENLKRTELEHRVRLVHHDLASGLPTGPFHLVVSNPPYIGEDEIELVQPEVRDWEPRAALVDTGQTSTVVREAYGELSSGGWLVLEIAEARADAVSDAMTARGYASVCVLADAAERERIVEGQKPS